MTPCKSINFSAFISCHYSYQFLRSRHFISNSTQIQRLIRPQNDSRDTYQPRSTYGHHIQPPPFARKLYHLLTCNQNHLPRSHSILQVMKRKLTQTCDRIKPVSEPLPTMTSVLLPFTSSQTGGDGHERHSFTYLILDSLKMYIW